MVKTLHPERKLSRVHGAGNIAPGRRRRGKSPHGDPPPVIRTDGAIATYWMLLLVAVAAGARAAPS
ncbi:MAG: hypothetical protein K8J08_19490 [Thermoanaerobaculia bacterium]|nr:hypothetical protein [Thermoanaerobaculia bacterium]